MSTTPNPEAEQPKPQPTEPTLYEALTTGRPIVVTIAKPQPLVSMLPTPAPVHLPSIFGWLSSRPAIDVKNINLDAPLTSELAGEKEPTRLALELVGFCRLIYGALDLVKAELEKRGCTQVTFFQKRSLVAVGFLLEDHAFLVFRGTDCFASWLLDLCFLLSGTPLRHTGFCWGWHGLQPQVQAWIAGLPDTSRRFILTGHSLGGALALLAAHALRSQSGDGGALYPVKAVITFGGPRVGGPAFARAYDSLNAGSVASPPRTLGAITWRFVHQQDLVPRVPSALLGYCHVGKMLYYNSACELIPNELADNHRCQDFIQAMTYHLRITPLTPEPLKVSNIDSQATSKFMSVIKAIKPSWELLRHTKYLFIPIGIDVILALIQAGFDHVNEHYVCIFPSLKPSPLPPQHVKLDCKTIIIMPLQIVAAILIVMLMLVFWFAGLMACAGWFLLKWFWRACQ